MFARFIRPFRTQPATQKPRTQASGWTGLESMESRTLMSASGLLPAVQLNVSIEPVALLLPAVQKVRKAASR